MKMKIWNARLAGVLMITLGLLLAASNGYAAPKKSNTTPAATEEKAKKDTPAAADTKSKPASDEAVTADDDASVEEDASVDENEESATDEDVDSEEGATADDDAVTDDATTEEDVNAAPMAPVEPPAVVAAPAPVVALEPVVAPAPVDEEAAKLEEALAIVAGIEDKSGASLTEAQMAALDMTVAAALSEPKIMLDTVWTMVAAFLVFWMNAGFALVESGFCRAKNTVNILAKNFIVFAIACLAYWSVGFGLMFGDGNSLLGMSGFFLSGLDYSPLASDTYVGSYTSLSWTTIPLEAKFFFQLVFAATAATIVSGAVAERIKFQAYILFATLLVMVMYPVTGHWIWGGGWLAAPEGGFLAGIGLPAFMDFAGSTVVHSVGGWAALVGIMLLGPRLGKYRADGGANAIPGHNISLATLGGLILWLGWFGFNPGSTMAANGVDIAHVATTTAMAAAAAVASSTAYAWMRLGKPDLSMIVNGSLAGLVAITAPCSVVSITGSVVIGFIAGVLVIEAVLAFDKLHIDDPVGATSVHLANGVWGTFAVGLFSTKSGLFYGFGFGQLVSQIIGIAAVAVFTVAASLIFWYITKAIVGLRVSPDEEYVGLDKSEMGLEAYPHDATTADYRMAKES